MRVRDGLNDLNSNERNKVGLCEKVNVANQAVPKK